MKKLALFTLFVVIFSTTMAQDLIVLKDATEVQAKVTAITEKSVTYKRWSNLEGPTYTISKSNVFYIKYANGEKDVMQSIKPNNSLTLNKFNPQSLTPIKFQGYGYVGTVFNAYEAGPSADISVGVKIYEYFFAGFQTGFHYIISDYDLVYIPIGLNITRLLNPWQKG